MTTTANINRPPPLHLLLLFLLSQTRTRPPLLLLLRRSINPSTQTRMCSSELIAHELSTVRLLHVGNPASPSAEAVSMEDVRVYTWCSYGEEEVEAVLAWWKSTEGPDNGQCEEAQRHEEADRRRRQNRTEAHFTEVHIAVLRRALVEHRSCMRDTASTRSTYTICISVQKKDS